MIVLILKFSSILLQTVLEGNTEEYTTDLATIGATFLGLYSSAPPKHALHSVPCTYMGHIILLLSQGGLVECQRMGWRGCALSPLECMKIDGLISLSQK